MMRDLKVRKQIKTRVEWGGTVGRRINFSYFCVIFYTATKISLEAKEAVEEVVYTRGILENRAGLAALPVEVQIG